MKRDPSIIAAPDRSSTGDAFGPRCRASHGAASVSALRASIDYREDDDFDDYEDAEIGCINCDAGWRHGCCDDLCRGSNEAQDCDYARKCLVCNKYGEIL